MNHALAAKIVSAYLRRNEISGDQMPVLITTVYEALAGLGKPLKAEPAARIPAVPIRRSVTANFVVCLDCGWQGKMLRRQSRLGSWSERRRVSLPVEFVGPASDGRTELLGTPIRSREGDWPRSRPVGVQPSDRIDGSRFESRTTEARKAATAIDRPTGTNVTARMWNFVNQSAALLVFCSRNLSGIRAQMRTKCCKRF